jgi:hypothetical protein
MMAPVGTAFLVVLCDLLLEILPAASERLDTPAADRYRVGTRAHPSPGRATELPRQSGILSGIAFLAPKPSGH